MGSVVAEKPPLLDESRGNWWTRPAGAKEVLYVALPLVVSLLAINLAMGVLNRSAPQLSVFSIGFPLTLLLGIAMLWLMMPGMTDWLSLLFRQALGAFQAVHEGLGTMP